MIFRPRVAPMYVKARAARGTVTAAARNAGSAAAGRAENRPARRGAATNTTAPTATDTAAANNVDRFTSARVRAVSPRPARMAINRTFATSMPNLVAAAAMNANWVVRVT